MGWFGPSKAEKDKKLWQAAQDGDEAELRRLIERGGNVNWHNPDDSGRTALICASIYGREGCVRLLLEAKAIEVNAKSNTGWTALHWAACHGYLAIAKRLLEGGADPTLRDNQGKTAIDLARENGKSEVVALLSEPRWDKTGAAKAAADKAAADKKAAAEKAAAERAAAEKAAEEKAAAERAAAERAEDKVSHWRMELDKMANARAELCKAQDRVRLLAAVAATEDESLRDATKVRNEARVALVRVLEDALSAHDEGEKERRSLTAEAAALQQQQQQGECALTLAEQVWLIGSDGL